jgi:outer membrane biosynthesis protein TonB
MRLGELPMTRSICRAGSRAARAAGLLLGLCWRADLTAQRADVDTAGVLTVEQLSVVPVLLRQPPLNYPDSLRRAGVAGTVAVRAILDAHGRLEPASFRVVESPDSALSALARAHLLDSKFSPALLKRHAVRAALELMVDFNPQGTAPDPLPIYTKDDGLSDPPRYLAGRDEPRYPRVLEQLGVDGLVIAQLIIDTLGRPEAESIQIVESPDPKFNAPVSGFVAAARFRPARIAGRAVRVLVWFPFSFRLRPGWAVCEATPFDPFRQRCHP